VLCLTCQRRQPGALSGQRLLALRLAAELTQRELARRSGVSRTAIAWHEHGTHVIEQATRAKLAQVLGRELLGGAGTKAPGSHPRGLLAARVVASPVGANVMPKRQSHLGNPP
jgi:transcriptional regulator with XRE-family HTH domain